MTSPPSPPPEPSDRPVPQRAATAAAQARAARLQAANINPRTGLATDYLNHFNEAIMLLEMIPDRPEALQDFLRWRPLSYREHFMASGLSARELAIEAYESTEIGTRTEFENITGEMTSILTTAGAALRKAGGQSARAELAAQATGWIKPLATLAAGVIHGGLDCDVDTVMAGE